MIKRSGKFYRTNEKDVMKHLGLSPTPNSGSGWIVKEDGENEDVICQLKSTDANSIKINKKDIDTLIYHGLVSHKIPIFAIQFLQDNEVYLLVRPIDLQDVSGLILGNRPNKISTGLESLETMENSSRREGLSNNIRHIKSGYESRKAFMSENDNKYKKKGKSAT